MRSSVARLVPGIGLIAALALGCIHRSKHRPPLTPQVLRAAAQALEEEFPTLDCSACEADFQIAGPVGDHAHVDFTQLPSHDPTDVRRSWRSSWICLDRGCSTLPCREVLEVHLEALSEEFDVRTEVTTYEYTAIVESPVIRACPLFTREVAEVRPANFWVQRRVRRALRAATNSEG